MTVITKLGSWFKKPEKVDEKEMIIDFIGDLESVLDSMGNIVDDVHEGYQDQVIKKRTFTDKILGVLPSFLQSNDVKEQSKKSTEIQQTKIKMSTLKSTLSHVKESVQNMDMETSTTSNETMGKRVYELAYPGESISSEKVETLEERLKKLENNFLSSMDDLNTQIEKISLNLQQLTTKLDSQGVKIDNIDEKIDIMDSKLDKVQKKLVSISRKLTQNRTLLALLTGSVIALVLIIIIL